MATIRPFATPIAGGLAVSWNNIAAGDTCLPWPDQTYASNIPMAGDFSVLTDRCVQTSGTTIAVFIEGSNAMTAALATAIGFATLHEVDGTTTLNMTTATVKQVLEATMFLRPNPGYTAAACNVQAKFVLSNNRF